MSEDQIKKLTSLLLQGNIRALGRVLTLVENEHGEGMKLLSLLPQTSKPGFVIGVTGAPGSGKSTLVDQIACELVSRGQKVGILAVDPSSPFGGGAILGDRIRMVNSSSSTSVFIRSIAARGAMGGLALRTPELIRVLVAAGYSTVIVETVGVGQSEVDIAQIANCSCLVLVPGMGDEVQALKAGIMEIADIYVINKADYPGADRLEAELLNGGSSSAKGIRPKIVQTVAVDGKGIKELVAEIDKHRTPTLQTA